jgi:prevent-host-death family protein
MKTIDVDDAVAQLPALVDEAASGEEIIIAQAGKPRVRLVPVEESKSGFASTRGMWKGKVWMSDDFNDPLPPEVLKEWGIE